MEFNEKVISIANRLRRDIQASTEDIDEGQSVPIALWWTFICDHAAACSLDADSLAREQLSAFLQHNPITVEQTH